MPSPINAAVSVLRNMRPKSRRTSRKLVIYRAFCVELLQWNADYISIGAATNTAGPIEKLPAKTHIVIIQLATGCERIVGKIPIRPRSSVAAPHLFGILNGNSYGILPRCSAILQQPNKHIIFGNIL